MESISRLLNQILGHYRKKNMTLRRRPWICFWPLNRSFIRGQFMKAVIPEETGRAS